MRFLDIKINTKYPNKLPVIRRLIPFVLLMFVVLYAFAGAGMGISQKTIIAPIDTIKKDTLKLKISKDAPKSKIKYTATDSAYFDIKNKKLYLITNAVMEYDNVKVEANYICVDWTTNRLIAYGTKDTMSDSTTGRPVLSINNEPYLADTMIYDFNTKKGKMKSVRTKQGEGFLYGETVKRNSDESVFMRHGWYTTCNLEHPHFQINISKVKLIPNKEIVTGPAYLVIADVPTPLIIPFGFFPITKGQRNGIIIPKFANEESPSGRGFGLLDGGYYFHVKSFADMRVTGSIFSKGSWIGSVASSYVKRYRFNGSISFNYATNKYGEPHTYEQTISKQFLFMWTHSINPLTHPGTSFMANVNLSSGGQEGNYLRRNSTNTTEFLNNEIRSNISFSKSFMKNKIILSLTADHSQNTLNHEVRASFPSGQFTINNIYPFRFKEHLGGATWYEKINTTYSLQFTNSLVSNDSMFYTKAQFNADTLRKYLRSGLMHSLPLSTSMTVLKYFNLSPTLSFRQRFYFSSIEKKLVLKGNYTGTNDSIYTKTVFGLKAPIDYDFGVALGTKIIGKFNFYRTKLIAIRHVFTPSLNFSYRPDYSDPKYGYYRQVGVADDTTHTKYTYYSLFENGVYGSPGLGRTATMGINIGNSFESKWKNKKDTVLGTKKIMLLDFVNLSTAYNFLADSLNLSNLSISAGTNILRLFNINFNSSFTPYAVDSSRNTEYSINKYLITTSAHKLVRLQNLHFGLQLSLNSEAVKKKKSNFGTAQELNDVNSHLNNYIDFTIPWNVSFNYNFEYLAPFKLIANADPAARQHHSLMMSGDLRLTANWKIDCNIYMDPSKLQLQTVAMNLYRDLHCWSMSLNLRPFGENRGFLFSLQAKSSLLQQLKLTRKFDARYY
jgi:lipopolysaccharide export system protein LptA